MDTRESRPDRGQVAFAALGSGAYASAATALLFLAVDAYRGAALFTPSLMGSVVLLGHPPAEVTEVRLDMVAAYSLVHFAAFTLLGIGVTLASRRVAALRSRAAVLAVAIFALLMVGAVVVDRLVYPGLVTRMGLAPVALANAAAAAVMARFIRPVLVDAGTATPSRGPS